MENSSASLTSTSYGGSTQSIFASHRTARPCAQHLPLQRSCTQVLKKTGNALLNGQDLSLGHGRRRVAGCKQATTCIAAPEIAERTFADGKVRKVRAK